MSTQPDKLTVGDAMVDAAYEVFKESGIVDDPSPGVDKITIRRMLKAALRAQLHYPNKHPKPNCKYSQRLPDGQFLVFDTPKEAEAAGLAITACYKHYTQNPLLAVDLDSGVAVTESGVYKPTQNTVCEHRDLKISAGGYVCGDCDKFLPTEPQRSKT